MSALPPRDQSSKFQRCRAWRVGGTAPSLGWQLLPADPRVDTALADYLQIVAVQFQEISDHGPGFGPRSRTCEECNGLVKSCRLHRLVFNIFDGLEHNRGPEPTVV